MKPIIASGIAILVACLGIDIIFTHFSLDFLSQKGIEIPDWEHIFNFRAGSNTPLLQSRPFPSFIEATTEDVIIGLEVGLFTSLELVQVQWFQVSSQQQSNKLRYTLKELNK